MSVVWVMNGTAIMAELLTRDKFDELIAELLKVRALMPPTALVCEKCHALFTERTATGYRYGQSCWCDYESDQFYD